MGSVPRKVFGGISLVLGLLALAASSWLLVVAVNDYRCKNFDRTAAEYYNQNRGFNQDRGGYANTRSRSWGYSGVFGRGWDRDSVEGRSTDDYCINLVDNWTLASGIGVGIALFQLILSAGYFTMAFTDEHSGAKAWTWTWCICHFLFAGGYAAALFIGISGDVHRYHHQTRNVGYLFCAATGVDAFLSILLSILCCIFVLRKLNGGGKSRRDDERPNSRTEFIPRTHTQQYPELSQPPSVQHPKNVKF